MPWSPTNNLECERSEKLERLRERGIEAYPNRVRRTHTTAAAIAAFEAVEKQGDSEAAESVEVSVCGRIRTVRVMGKVAFAHIEDGTGRLQLFIRQDMVGSDTYDMFRRDLDIGDFVEAQGIM